MHLPDLLHLAASKLGPHARFAFCVVDAKGERAPIPAKEGAGLLAQAEVYLSARAGANVPDAAKSRRVIGQAPFVKPRHDPTGTRILDPSRDAALDALAEALSAMPDAVAASSRDEQAP
jgi:hypothetical protein